MNNVWLVQNLLEVVKEEKAPAKTPVKPAEKAPEKAAPQKTTTKTAEKPVVAESKKTETKKPEVKKPVTEEKSKVESPANAPSIGDQLKAKEEKLPLPKLFGKATRSNESIYSKYQIVTGEYRSLDEALKYEDGFTKVGYNAAVIQFKDGKFGICVARTADKAKADRLLIDIKHQLPDTWVKLKEY